MTAEVPKKAKRGRPHGSSRLNGKDASILTQAARLMVETPSLKLTAALRQLGINNYEQPSDVRRLQRKWKKDRELYLQKAQEEACEVQEVTPADLLMLAGKAAEFAEIYRRAILPQQRIMEIARFAETLNRAIEPAAIAIAKATQNENSPFMRLVRGRL